MCKRGDSRISRIGTGVSHWSENSTMTRKNLCKWAECVVKVTNIVTGPNIPTTQTYMSSIHLLPFLVKGIVYNFYKHKSPTQKMSGLINLPKWGYECLIILLLNRVDFGRMTFTVTSHPNIGCKRISNQK